MSKNTINIKGKITDANIIINETSLESIIIEKITKNAPAIHQMIIKKIHNNKITKLREHIMTRLNGQTITSETLIEHINNAVIELEIDISKISQIEEEQLKKVGYIFDQIEGLNPEIKTNHLVKVRR